ncbi:MAG: CDP-alcohol phosphatidyltransferase family protein [Bacilli bacterium]|nr:CDP-alcohol phosphatidyltransferase family protein [Bacilli bacterium]
MKDEIKKYWEEFKLGTKTMFKEFFKKDTNKKQRANMWTFARLIIPLITLITSIIAISTVSIPLFIGTGIIAGMGAVTDFFDGKSARKHGSTSEYGKLLDQASDKFFAGVIGINLLFLNPAYISILFGEGLIAIVNILYKVKNKDLNITSTTVGKIKEWPLFFALALGFLSTINPTLFTISNYSIMLTTLFQLTTVASYIVENNKSLEKLKREKLLNIFLEFEEKKETQEKVNVFENNKQLNKNKTISRAKQCEELRKLRDELTMNEDKKTFEEKGYQKTKK